LSSTSDEMVLGYPVQPSEKRFAATRVNDPASRFI
jgi:hypothetical protein